MEEAVLSDLVPLPRPSSPSLSVSPSPSQEQSPSTPRRPSPPFAHEDRRNRATLLRLAPGASSSRFPTRPSTHTPSSDHASRTAHRSSFSLGARAAPETRVCARAGRERPRGGRRDRLQRDVGVACDPLVAPRRGPRDPRPRGRALGAAAWLVFTEVAHASRATRVCLRRRRRRAGWGPAAPNPRPRRPVPRRRRRPRRRRSWRRARSRGSWKSSTSSASRLESTCPAGRGRRGRRRRGRRLASHSNARHTTPFSARRLRGPSRVRLQGSLREGLPRVAQDDGSSCRDQGAGALQVAAHSPQARGAHDSPSKPRL